jgi:hypothetical protein
LPIKILQNNKRVAETQFICDICGKLIRTCVIPQSDLEAEKSKAVECWQCKQPNHASKKT